MAVNTTITEPPEFLRSYYAALAQRGADLGNRAFTPYTQPRVAPWNQQQDMAANMVQQRALSGSPYMNQAGGWFSNLLNGGFNINNVPTYTGPSSIAASGQVSNISAPGSIQRANATLGPSAIAASGQIGPIAQSDTISGANAYFGPNSIASGGAASAGSNPYAGMNNPYLNTAIDRAMGDVESRINSRFNGNAFGGTAHQQTLARELGNVSNAMRMQDYSAQQGLAENAVNRDLSNQQYNINNANALNQYNAGLGMQNANIANQMGQFNAGIQGQNVANRNAINQVNAGLQGQNIANTNSINQYNANLGMQNAGIQNQMAQFNSNLSGQDIANQQAANQFNAGLQGQNIANTNAINQYNAGLGWNAANAQNQMGQFNAGLQQNNISRQQQGLAFAPTLAANDYADANAMMGLGNQLFGYNQSIADANYQEFLRQQQYPSQQLQWMQAGLNPSQSAFSNSSTTTPDAQSSPIAGAIGGGMAGYGALSGLNSIYNTGISPWLGAGLGALGGLLL